MSMRVGLVGLPGLASSGSTKDHSWRNAGGLQGHLGREEGLEGLEEELRKRWGC